jgi:diacylglycerol kinase (ATP)
MNNKPESFSLSGRIRSGTHALDGITELFKSQQNAWVHAVATVCVIAAGLVLGVTGTEWCLLILVITAVWVVEALNTAFEYLCDVVSPEFHPLVKKSKDIAAGAVLLSAVGAAAIGLMIFVPYLLAYL